jgi:DNA-binding NarL/FixJ family response regulator
VDAGRRAAVLSRLEQHYARFDLAARRLDGQTGGSHIAPAPVLPEASQDLTARELDVLQLVAEGLTDREIAAELLIGDQTVKSHVRRVMVKLRARNRTHAVITALRQGRLSLEAEPEARAA